MSKMSRVSLLNR